VQQQLLILLDRRWGKSPQTHTAEDCEGEITVIARHLVRVAMRRGIGRSSTRLPCAMWRRVVTSICHSTRAGWDRD
jgi:hypothetical protein